MRGPLRDGCCSKDKVSRCNRGGLILRSRIWLSWHLHVLHVCCCVLKSCSCCIVLPGTLVEVFSLLHFRFRGFPDSAMQRGRFSLPCFRHRRHYMCKYSLKPRSRKTPQFVNIPTPYYVGSRTPPQETRLLNALALPPFPVRTPCALHALGSLNWVLVQGFDLKYHNK